MTINTVLIFLINILKFFLVNFLPILVCVIFYTLAERKAMASVQRRLGPSYITRQGLAQPLADGIKALLKESIIPKRANKILFIIAPCIVLIIGFGN
jgi:NADH:ubiquinone oxidoreductase subunit H